ncbi:sulfatase [Opitutia bacterium ISCC 51]|nr:sulfatase [Opitutae bacterium ISCC 51]QXD30235.1 sulfatase [Opitutae bacterium ISCC 52]
MAKSRFILVGAILVIASFLKASERPHILFISIDDLNDWIGPLGHEQAKTPNMDRLAERGITFTNAHSPSMICNPTRTAIMLGLHPSSTGIFGNGPDWRTIDATKDKATIPRFFREAGYQTVGAGKLFHGSTFAPAAYLGYNDPNGWDAFWPSLDRQLPDEIGPHERPANGGPERNFDWSPVVAHDSAIGDGQVVSWSVEKILEQSESPRFNAVGIYRPHEPWFVPQSYFDLYPLESIQLPEVLEGDLDDVSPVATSRGGPAGRTSSFALHDWVLEDKSLKRWKEGVQGYLASISFADTMLGLILDALDESGRADDTIIVLWSDHGFHLGEKGRWRKGSLWGESHRVPFIVVAPGVTTPGSTSHSPVSTMDLYATLTELTGLKAPDHVQGTSLVPLLKDPNKRPDRAVVSSSAFRTHVVSGERFRYLSYPDGSEEFYDIENDPHEWHNLASDSGYAGHKTRLAKWLPKKNAPQIGGARGGGRGGAGRQGGPGGRAQTGPRGEGPQTGQGGGRRPRGENSDGPNRRQAQGQN